MRMIDCLAPVAINPAAFRMIRLPRYPPSILTKPSCSVLAPIHRRSWEVIGLAAVNPLLLTKGQLPAGVRGTFRRGLGLSVSGFWGRGEGFVFFHAVTQISLSHVGWEG